MLTRLRKLVTRYSSLVTYRELVAAAAVGCLAATGPAQPPKRAAILLPPRPLEASEPGPVARAAIDDNLPLATTPVTRSQKPTGPAWLYDSNVVPASGPAAMGQPSRVQPAGNPAVLPPGTQAQPQPSPISRGFDRVKGFVTGDRQEPRAFPADGQPPAPNAPLRGTAPNGAPVYAGPPAWRWYGYGTVTPGANPLAPTGQYPKASANWYAVTAATPGAVPVPVMNPLRPTPGSEPPVYMPEPAARSHTTPAPVTQPTTHPVVHPVTQPAPPAAPSPPPAGGSKFAPAPASKFEPT